jgi:hypothetical protein
MNPRETSRERADLLAPEPTFDVVLDMRPSRTVDALLAMQRALPNEHAFLRLAVEAKHGVVARHEAHAPAAEAPSYPARDGQVLAYSFDTADFRGIPEHVRYAAKVLCEYGESVVASGAEPTLEFLRDTRGHCVGVVVLATCTMDLDGYRSAHPELDEDGADDAHDNAERFGGA